MLVWWTNRSRPPSSEAMNPKPFSSLNHFTVPVGMSPPWGSSCYRRGLSADHPVARSTFTAGASRRSEGGTVAWPPDMDDSIILSHGATIPMKEVELRTSRSSGPGGQHANVTASRVEASFDVNASAALTPAQKRRLLARTGPRVVAVAQDSRSQARNRQLALER